MPLHRLLIPLMLMGTPAMALGADYLPGAGADFSYSNASDLNGSFGQPITSGVDNNLFFPFANFGTSADGSNPNTSTSDTITLDLLANTGLRFDAVGFIFNGTLTLSGAPGGNSVQSDGALTVNGLAGNPFSGSDSYTFFDDQPPAQGSAWSESLFVPIPPGARVSELHLSLSQGLIAIATDGGAQITATLEIASGISLSIIPEPSSLVLLGFGGLFFGRRRRPNLCSR